MQKRQDLLSFLFYKITAGNSGQYGWIIFKISNRQFTSSSSSVQTISNRSPLNKVKWPVSFRPVLRYNFFLLTLSSLLELDSSICSKSKDNVNMLIIKFN